MKRARIIAGYASFVATRPGWVIAASVLLLALSLWSASGIVMETKIADMLPPDDPAGRSYLEITDAFATTSSLMVMVEGESRGDVIAAAEDLAARIRGSAELAPYLRSVRLKVDESFLENWGFILQKPEDIRDNAEVLERSNLLPLLRAMNLRLEDTLGGDDSSSEVDDAEEENEAVALMDRIGLFAEDLRAAAEGRSEPGEAGGRLARDFLLGDGYLLDPEGKTLVFSVTPSFDLGERKALTALVDGARELARSVEASRPGIGIAFAGDVASESDEEKALGFDTFYPSLIAYAAVLLLFFLSFSRPRSVLFALASLAVGIVVDLGFAGLAVGELNMVTSSFGSILVGLGIDFGVHICSRFDEAIVRGETRRRAVEEAIRETIVPVSMGALTTAAAFFMLLVSKTVAFRQFALVSGFGILSTLAAMYSLLPALLAAAGGGGKSAARRPLLDYSFAGRLAGWAARRPFPVLGISAALVAASLFGIRLSRFQYDMREIGPSGTEALAAEATILERFDLSSYAVLAAAGSLEEVRSLDERVSELPMVRSAETLADYLPAAADQEARLAEMRRIALAPPRWEALPWDGAACEALALEVERLEDNLVELGDLAAASLGEDNLVVRKRSAMIREIFGAEVGAPGAEVFSRLASALRAEGAASRIAAADASFAPALDSLARRMSSSRRPITESDLPPDLLGDYRSPEGDAYLLIAYPDRSLAGDESLVSFADELAALSPSITGSLLLGVQLSRLSLSEALTASAFVAAAIFVLVLAGFRSLGPTLLALANVAIGMALTFGLFPLLEPYNIVNVLVLPLIIGIGIDYGIHLVHASRDGSPPGRAMAKIGRAVLLSSVTTMFGFGSLGLVGRFRGVASLGKILFVGTAACLASTLLVLPAIIALVQRRGRRRRLAGAEGANNVA
ncbi:MAG TPA: MMPL family transporter [Spirochaetales bacterium]|nr:MMPL family transporter [Spirochaetales bacterium]HRY54921.1 MMPL family transporter [Spirochaetia bacterium]HRZ63508.1 MMPL family transporter [Spirochaetia bacterium]